jgi:hypothetical protein
MFPLTIVDSWKNGESQIVNDDTIYKEAGETVYYHVECAKHSAIVANGVLSETYVDLDNRHMFEESERFQPRNIQFHSRTYGSAPHRGKTL